jgi:hypothetical protein
MLMAAGAVPLMTMVHELAHFVAYRVFGFETSVLHYASATAMPTPAHPAWQLGLAAAAGPTVSMLALLGCCAVVRRCGPRPMAVTGGLATIIRLPFVTASASLLFGGDRASQLLVDELNAATAFHVSALTIMIPEVCLVCLAAIWLLSRWLTCGRSAILSTLIGTVIGAGLYYGVVGPVLLP